MFLCCYRADFREAAGRGRVRLSLDCSGNPERLWVWNLPLWERMSLAPACSPFASTCPPGWQLNLETVWLKGVKGWVHCRWVTGKISVQSVPSSWWPSSFHHSNALRRFLALPSFEWLACPCFLLVFLLHLPIFTGWNIRSSTSTVLVFVLETLICTLISTNVISILIPLL